MIVQIQLSSRASSGLLGIWRWVEKLVNGTYQTYTCDYNGWWTYCYGAVKRDARFYISFNEAGTYRIRARARDMLNQQSIIPVAEFTVTNWP